MSFSYVERDDDAAYEDYRNAPENCVDGFPKAVLGLTEGWHNPNVGQFMNHANVGDNEGACLPSEVRREEISGTLKVGCAQGGDVTLAVGEKPPFQAFDVIEHLRRTILSADKAARLVYPEEK